MKTTHIFPKGDLVDEELVLLVQKGDHEAFSILSHRYESALKGCAGRYIKVAGAETEDFFQEGLIALYRAARGYRPGGKACFRTYAVTCINHSIMVALRLHVRRQHCKSLVSVEQLDDAASGRQPVEQFFLDREAFLQWADHIRTRLSQLERKVLYHYLSGYSYQQISQILSTSAKTVDNALQRVRRKLRLHL